MALLPYTMASRAGKRLLAGGRSGGATGAGVGAVAGGLHGAVTDDPNNPNEGRMGRIVSGALGGAAMGAGAGGAIGAGRAHVGNLTRAATNTGRMQGFAGGLAAGAGAAAGAGKAKNFVQGFSDRAAAQSSTARRAAKVQGQQAVHPGGAPIPAPAAGTFDKMHAGQDRRTAKVQSQQAVQQGGAPIAAPGTVAPPKPSKQDPYYNQSSEFYGGAEAAAPGQSGPSMMGRVKGKIQDIRQNRAASHAAESEARSFVDKGQWKTSSPGFWSGFSNRAHGVF